MLPAIASAEVRGLAVLPFQVAYLLSAASGLGRTRELPPNRIAILPREAAPDLREGGAEPSCKRIRPLGGLPMKHYLVEPAGMYGSDC